MSLDEILLRRDPGDAGILTIRVCRVWEGGGEYNRDAFVKLLKKDSPLLNLSGLFRLGNAVGNLTGQVFFKEVAKKATAGSFGFPSQALRPLENVALLTQMARRQSF